MRFRHRGEAKPAKLHVPAEIHVQSMRSKLHLSQDDFAAAFGFTLNQMRDWEQGRSRPLGGNRAYLMLIDLNAEAVLEILRHQDVPGPIGWDLSSALTYRPLFTQNVVFRVSGAALIPGIGTKALFNTQGGAALFGTGNLLYSVMFNVILTY